MACILDLSFKDLHFFLENYLIQLLQDGEADQPAATGKLVIEKEEERRR